MSNPLYVNGLEERLAAAEAEVRKYRALFLAATMKYALVRDELNPCPDFCEKVANVGLAYRQDWFDLFGVEARLHATVCAELDKLLDQVKERQS